VDLSAARVMVAVIIIIEMPLKIHNSDYKTKKELLAVT
jgi:hypothetical protein